MGSNTVASYLLKQALTFITDPLTYVYNLSIEQNIFPTALKTSKVVPLLKTNDSSHPNRYRPVFLLPIVSEPLQGHIHKHLLQYLERERERETERETERQRETETDGQADRQTDREKETTLSARINLDSALITPVVIINEIMLV